MSIYHGTDADELAECLESVKQQTVKPSETVIVFDGPVSARVQEVVESYNIPLAITRVRLETNEGLGAALQAGLLECQWNLVARIDCDDKCSSGRFEKQLDFMRHNVDIDVLGGAQAESSSDFPNRAIVRRLPHSHPDIARFAKFRNPINHPTVIFRKRSVLAVGGYRPFDLLEDYYLWVRMIRAGFKFANLPDVLVESCVDHSFYRRRGGARYIASEVRLAREFLRMGFQNRFEYLLFLSSRIPMRLVSPRMRDTLYRLVLRRTGR